MVAVDVNPARLETALESGAEHVVNAAEEDPVAAIQRLGGADAAISTAATPIAFEQAFRSLARGGRLVCVGLPAENRMEIPIFETVLGGLDVRGPIVGTRHDLEEVLDGTAPAPRLVFRMTPVDHAATNGHGRGALAAAGH